MAPEDLTDEPVAPQLQGTGWSWLDLWPVEMAVLNAAAGAPEDSQLRWGRMKGETGRAKGGLEEKKVQNEERGSSVVGGQWTVWDKKLTFGLLGGILDLSAAARSAAHLGGGLPETEPG